MATTTTTGLLKRTQKFIAGNSKFDMNFIYLHVNRICVTPKTFEREIYEQQSQSQSQSKLATVKRSDSECIVERVWDLDPEPRAQPEGRRLWARWRLNEYVRQLRAFLFLFLSSSPGYLWMSRRGWAFCLFYVLCFVFVILLFCSCCCLLFFVWTHFIVGHRTFFAAFLYHSKCSRIWTGDSCYACMITRLAHWTSSSLVCPLCRVFY